MKERLNELTLNHYELIYVDEMMVTKNTFKKKEWAFKNKPKMIDLRHTSGATTDCIAGISFKNGFELVQQHDHSVNVDKFLNFVTKLRQKNPFRKMAIFFDQLSVHMAKRTRDKIEDLGMQCMNNASYYPDGNPIETIFSIVKKEIKKSRLQHILNNKKYNLKKIIDEKFQSV